MTFRLALLLTLAGCVSDGPAIAIRDAYSFEPVLGQVGALYFTMENRGDLPDTLVDVVVAGAPVAMIHEQGTGAEMVAMEHVAMLAIAPRSSVAMAPGGLHVMIEGMRQAPVAGDTLQVTARFARAGPLSFKAPVIPYGADR